MEEKLLTPQEVADLLKVKKNTVYFMIKRGELPATKLGKQLRIRQADVDSMFQPDSPAQTAAEPPPDPQYAQPSFLPLFFPENAAGLFAGGARPLILCGQDILIDMICDRINSSRYGMQMLRTYLGSYTGLYALYQEQVAAATCHLWDAETDTYNVSYVPKLLLGEEVRLFHLCNRRQGFYVAKSNPKSIAGFEDLRRSDLVFLNREKGSGTRVLLDGMLRRMQLNPQSLQGYYRIVSSDLLAASTVAKGEADFALGCERASFQVANVDFIPLKAESYDLAVRQYDMHLPLIQRMIEVIQSPDFANEVKPLNGYDVTDMGRQLL